MDLSIVISLFALAVSVVTAWLTLLRKGTVRMTRPTQIYFGPDQATAAKVYVKTLLFATAKRGRIVESMFVTLTRDERRQTFSVWVVGEHDSTTRGAGVHVGENGLATAHHFPAPADAAFEFGKGTYRLQIFAKLFGSAHPTELFADDLTITSEQVSEMKANNGGIYFDWSAESGRYLPIVDVKRPRPMPGEPLTYLLPEKAERFPGNG